jgi:hypothetical protein
MFDGHMSLELSGVSDVAERETVQRSANAEIGRGLSNLRNVKWSVANAGHIGKGASTVRQSMMLERTRT